MATGSRRCGTHNADDACVAGAARCILLDACSDFLSQLRCAFARSNDLFGIFAIAVERGDANDRDCYDRERHEQFDEGDTSRVRPLRSAACNKGRQWGYLVRRHIDDR